MASLYSNACAYWESKYSLRKDEVHEEDVFVTTSSMRFHAECGNEEVNIFLKMFYVLILCVLCFSVLKY